MPHIPPCRSLAADAAIDLQLHTTYSDGAWEPAELLAYVRREEFGLVAITDHDRVETLPLLQDLASTIGIPLLMATEMTTTWRGELVDLLCFGFDPQAAPLRQLAAELAQRQQANSQAVWERLATQGYACPPTALAELLTKPSAQQPHALVALLRAHGHGLGSPSAGELALAAGLEFATNDPAAVVAATHASGGVCLLAHPGRDDGFVPFDAQRLDAFCAEIAIDGLEVYYPLHTAEQTALYRAYAEHNNLLISAGSDSHRPAKPPIKYRADQCRALLARLGIAVVG